MVTKVSVVAPIGGSFPDLEMPVLDSGPDDPIVVRHIKGLEPVTAEVNTKGYGHVDGEYYVDSRLPKRNIVLTLGLNNVDAGLPLLYGYFMPKTAVLLKFDVVGFLNDSFYIKGYVEGQPFDRFTPDPEPQISIICPKPNFWKAEEVVTGTTGSTPESFPYQGNLIAGFDLTMEMDESGFNGDIFVEVDNTGVGLGYRHFKLENAQVSSGRTFHLNTIQGSKSVETTPLDENWPHNNLLDRMSNDSFWLTLWPNTIHFRVRLPDWETDYDYTLRYSEQFGGI